MYHRVDSVRLTNGHVIRRDEIGSWPALQDECPGLYHMCDICPIRRYCYEDAEFDCRVHFMFSGFDLKDEYLEVFDNQYDKDEAIIRSGAWFGPVVDIPKVEGTPSCPSA